MLYNIIIEILLFSALHSQQLKAIKLGNKMLTYFSYFTCSYKPSARALCNYTLISFNSAVTCMWVTALLQSNRTDEMLRNTNTV